MAYFPAAPSFGGSNLGFQYVELPPLTGTINNIAGNNGQALVLASPFIVAPSQPIDPNMQYVDIPYFYRFQCDGLHLHEAIHTTSLFVFVYPCIVPHGVQSWIMSTPNANIRCPVQTVGYGTQSGFADVQLGQRAVTPAQFPLNIVWLVGNNDTISHSVDIKNLRGSLQGWFPL